MVEFKKYLAYMVKIDGSDLYLTEGAPPSIKVQGDLKPLTKQVMNDERLKEIAYGLMDEEKIAEFEQKPEMNMAMTEEGVGRFRINIFKQRNHIALVIRYIKTDIPTMDALGLPEILTSLVMEKHGLILFVGATGSGKSTSLAALIDFRNTNSAGHIITIEDPIEFVHSHT